jgi:hypothetical protein
MPPTSTVSYQLALSDVRALDAHVGMSGSSEIRPRAAISITANRIGGLNLPREPIPVFLQNLAH